MCVFFFFMYRGVTTIDVSLNSLDIQQCDLSGEDQGGVFDPFVGTHRCKNTTTVSKTTTTTTYLILIVVPISIVGRIQLINLNMLMKGCCYGNSYVYHICS